MSSSRTLLAQAARSFSQASTRTARVPAQRRLASGGPSYNEPTGYLFAEKPPAPGQKRVKEDWENIYYVGMFGTMGLAAVLLYFKPDTSIQTWATEEAKKRMEEKGTLPTYTPSKGGR